MRLAALQSLDVSALWLGLDPQAQAAIGTAAITQEIARLVAEDDGSEAPPDDRRAASVLADVATDTLSSAVEAAFPEIAWWNP